MHSSPLEHRIRSNGLEHRVLEWLPETHNVEMPPVGVALLLHGYMDAAGSWDLVAPSLANAGIRTLAPDFRGFGRGVRITRGSYYHFAEYVADVDGIARHLASDQPLYLIGHSMGGNVATLFTGAFPERVAKLASLEGLGPPSDGYEAAPTRMRAWLTQTSELDARIEKAANAKMTREQARKRLKANHPNVDETILETRLAHLTIEHENGTLSWAFDPAHRFTSPTPFYVQAFIEFIKRITCPVLFIRGGENGYHPPTGDECLRAFANLQNIQINDAGHMMHWTRPAELAQHLIQFLLST